MDCSKFIEKMGSVQMVKDKCNQCGKASVAVLV
jgi:hypothetical protein